MAGGGSFAPVSDERRKQLFSRRISGRFLIAACLNGCGKGMNMAVSQTNFQSYLEEQINRYKGVYMPAKTGFLKRAFVKSASCNVLHPNPDDEFCDPKIGPNYDIISSYEQQIRKARMYKLDRFFDEPLTVEKIRPDGYRTYQLDAQDDDWKEKIIARADEVKRLIANEQK